MRDQNLKSDRTLVYSLTLLWLLLLVLAPDWLSGLSLPLAVAIAALLALADTKGPLAAERIMLGVTGLFVAAFLYLLYANAPLLPRLLAVEVPPVVRDLSGAGWALLNFAAIGWLPTLAHQRPNRGYRLALAGMAAGGLLLLNLAYPVYTWLSQAYVPLHVTTSSEQVVMGLYLLAAAGLALLLGPAAAGWAGAVSGKERLGMGVVTGAMAASLLFGFMGISAAGIVANAPLYGVTVSRLGYGEAEWLGKLAIAVNLTFPIAYTVFWALLLILVLLAGVTAWLSPFRPAPAGPALKMRSPWPFLAMLVMPPILYLNGVVSIAILTLLGPQIADVMDRANVTSRWDPLWITPLVTFEPWLIAVAIQFMGLIALVRLPLDSKIRRPAAFCAYIYFVVQIVFLVLLYFINPGFFGWPTGILGLLMLGLSLAGVMTGRQLSRSQMAPNERESAPTLLHWIVAGGSVGAAVGVIVHHLPGTVLSLTMITVVMVEELSQFTAPAPGVPWLEKIFLDLFQVQATVFYGVVGSGAAVGVIAGYFLSLFVPFRLRPGAPGSLPAK